MTTFQRTQDQYKTSEYQDESNDIDNVKERTG